jgi:hypothetical protein
MKEHNYTGCMAKTKLLMVRITEKQERLLQDRAIARGFAKKSEYARIVLFHQKTIEEKLDAIYKKVTK